ncbi:hypothetical protein [Streptomyces luteireticuli]|uniref:Uncharacterized protein n=1 Tax=Streptomyces luteireticuli TaxID=173858 RepID=A0ABN0Z320_9ACTN
MTSAAPAFANVARLYVKWVGGFVAKLGLDMVTLYLCAVGGAGIAYFSMSAHGQAIERLW